MLQRPRATSCTVKRYPGFYSASHPLLTSSRTRIGRPRPCAKKNCCRCAAGPELSQRFPPIANGPPELNSVISTIPSLLSWNPSALQLCLRSSTRLLNFSSAFIIFITFIDYRAFAPSSIPYDCNSHSFCELLRSFPPSSRLAPRYLLSGPLRSARSLAASRPTTVTPSHIHGCEKVKAISTWPSISTGRL